jgi:hypothetical protein
MVISASRRTDIPAFYGTWLVNRLRAGFCMTRNPMNGVAGRIPLARPEAEGIVLWTKNFRPFEKHLPAVADSGLPFYVQYTINGYPPALERNVVEWQRSVDTVHRLASRFGPRSVVWRYDPIVFSRLTPPEFHLDNFGRIARSLASATDQAAVSFVQVYRKTRRNMDRMAADCDNPWWDPPIEEKRAFVRQLAGDAAGSGITLTVCSQPEIALDLPSAHCVDARRLSDVAGAPISAATLPSRPGCVCSASRDVGEYDTCPHACAYCYAVRSPDLAVRRFRSHDPESEYLFGAPDTSPDRCGYADAECERAPS